MEGAAKAIAEADLLFANGFFKGAVSRLYYSLLYTIRALLLTRGLEPKSHEGALRLFSLHFVKEGPFEAKASHTFSKMMKYREEADYNPGKKGDVGVKTSYFLPASVIIPRSNPPEPSCRR